METHTRMRQEKALHWYSSMSMHTAGVYTFSLPASLRTTLHLILTTTLTACLSITQPLLPYSIQAWSAGLVIWKSSSHLGSDAMTESMALHC